MHFCTAKIRLAGNVGMEVVRDQFNPLSYPELDVLRAIHGDDAVLDVKIVAHAEQTARAEKERLQLKYGGIVEEVFPGRSPRMELDAPKADIDPDLVWVNPLDPEKAGYDVDPVEKAEKPHVVKKTRVVKDNPFDE